MTHKCTLAVSTLAITVSFGLAAMAGELPKEGTYKGTYSAVGTFKVNQVDKDHAFSTLDETGLQLTDGVFDHTTWHCFGGSEIIKGQAVDQGHCIATDLAGDKFVSKFISEKHALDQKTFTVTATCEGGTGKYVGMTCNETDIVRGNEFPSPPEGTYVVYVTLSGTYKLP